jgi:hypothetical protein
VVVLVVINVVAEAAMHPVVPAVAAEIKFAPLTATNARRVAVARVAVKASARLRSRTVTSAGKKDISVEFVSNAVAA